MSKFPSTVIAYEGPSQLTGQPIVAIITGLERPSLNKKTGDMAQVMIFDANERPTDALESLADENVCGDCPLRKNICYVNLGHFNKVWDSYKSGNTVMLTQEILERAKANNKKLRITAYGDPSAIPFRIWENLLEYFTHHTGYTHQWRHLDSRWSKFLMASCETPQDVVRAAALGWSTFRVRTPDAPMLSAEIQCPNVANPSIQCSNCRLCAGNERKLLHISIEVHGLNHKIQAFERLTTAQQ